MAGRPVCVRWEQVTRQWWNSSIGYVSEESGIWTAYVYRNQRTGSAWTDHKTGFDSAVGAMRWVETEAED